MAHALTYVTSSESWKSWKSRKKLPTKAHSKSKSPLFMGVSVIHPGRNPILTKYSPCPVRVRS
jgi:hypothetical protein